MKKYVVFVAIGSLYLSVAAAQQNNAMPASSPAPATAPAPAPAPAPASPYERWGLKFGFLFDGYTDANFNHPDSGFNGVRNFDVRSDTLHVSMGKMSIEKTPGPVGFRLDFGFGQTFRIMHSAEQFPSEADWIEQAYVSLKPKSWKGFQVDFGKFVTSAGAEVIESDANWNYSRSLLFALAIPYYHFGIRTSFPVGEHFTGGVQLVNGWNNVKDNNTGKTIGLTGAYTFKKGTWYNNYYTGPEKSHTNDGWRNLYDTTIALNPTEKLSTYINFDYGQDKNIGSGASKWGGIAGAMRYAFTKKYAVASRIEYFKDADGFSTGTVQGLKEFTLTGEYKITNWLITRGEFRTDWSNQPFFEKENGQFTTRQPTVLFALIASLK